MYPEVDQVYSVSFFYAYKMTILNNFLTPNCAIFIGFSGYPVKKKQAPSPPPPRKKTLIIPILAACFSQRQTTKITKDQAAQKKYDSNDCS